MTSVVCRRTSRLVCSSFTTQVSSARLSGSSTLAAASTQARWSSGSRDWAAARRKARMRGSPLGERVAAASVRALIVARSSSRTTASWWMASSHTSFSWASAASDWALSAACWAVTSSARSASASGSGAGGASGAVSMSEAGVRGGGSCATASCGKTTSSRGAAERERMCMGTSGLVGQNREVCEVQIEGHGDRLCAALVLAADGEVVSL